MSAKKSSAKQPGPTLTKRETEIVKLIAKGEKRSCVADRLGISHHTVDAHMRRVFAKIGCHSAAAAVFFLSR